MSRTATLEPGAMAAPVATPAPPSGPALMVEVNRPSNSLIPPNWNLRIERVGPQHASLVLMGTLLPMRPLDQIREAYEKACSRADTLIPLESTPSEREARYYVMKRPEEARGKRTLGGQWWSVGEYALLAQTPDYITLKDCYTITLRKGTDPHWALSISYVHWTGSDNPEFPESLQSSLSRGLSERPEILNLKRGHLGMLLPEGTPSGYTIWVPPWMFEAYETWIKLSKMTSSTCRPLPFPVVQLMGHGDNHQSLLNGSAPRVCWGPGAQPVSADLRQKGIDWESACLLLQTSYDYRNVVEPYADTGWNPCLWDASPLQKGVAPLTEALTHWMEQAASKKVTEGATLRSRLKGGLQMAVANIPGWFLSTKGPTWRTLDGKDELPVQRLDTNPGTPRLKVDWLHLKGSVRPRATEVEFRFPSAERGSEPTYKAPWDYAALMRYMTSLGLFSSQLYTRRRDNDPYVNVGLENLAYGMGCLTLNDWRRFWSCTQGANWVFRAFEQRGLTRRTLKEWDLEGGVHSYFRKVQSEMKLTADQLSYPVFGLGGPTAATWAQMPEGNKRIWRLRKLLHMQAGGSGIYPVGRHSSGDALGFATMIGMLYWAEQRGKEPIPWVWNNSLVDEFVAAVTADRQAFLEPIFGEPFTGPELLDLATKTPGLGGAWPLPEGYSSRQSQDCTMEPWGKGRGLLEAGEHIGDRVSSEWTWAERSGTAYWMRKEDAGALPAPKSTKKEPGKEGDPRTGAATETTPGNYGVNYVDRAFTREGSNCILRVYPAGMRLPEAAAGWDESGTTFRAVQADGYDFRDPLVLPPGRDPEEHPADESIRFSIPCMCPRCRTHTPWGSTRADSGSMCIRCGEAYVTAWENYSGEGRAFPESTRGFAPDGLPVNEHGGPRRNTLNPTLVPGNVLDRFSAPVTTPRFVERAVYIPELVTGTLSSCAWCGSVQSWGGMADNLCEPCAGRRRNGRDSLSAENRQRVTSLTELTETQRAWILDHTRTYPEVSS